MSERVIEVALFLMPLLGIIAWRFVLPARVPQIWLVAAGAGMTVLLLGALLWMHLSDAVNADRAYVPAELHRGQVVGGHAGAVLPPRTLDGHGNPAESD